MTAATLEQARAARLKLAAMLEEVPELRGLGIAVLDGGYGLKVNLAAEVSSVVIPYEMDGVPVIVEIVGGLRPL